MSKADSRHEVARRKLKDKWELAAYVVGESGGKIRFRVELVDEASENYDVSADEAEALCAMVTVPRT